MTDYTYNTGNPTGSTDVRDGVDNLKSFDVLLNSQDDTYQDRLGNTVSTAAGAIKRLGPVRVDWTFTIGGTLNYPNEAALNPADGNYYGWTGALPKVVAPGTDPTLPSSGYVPRTDVVLRDEIFGVKGYISKTYTISSLFPSLQDAMNYAATNNVILYVQAGELFSDPILIPSNLHCVFHESAEIKANSGFTTYQTLLDFSGASNVIFETNGCLFWMPKSEYTSGEWRHCFNLKDASRVQILGAPKIEGAGGDGIYISNLTNSYIDRPFVNKSRRNNVSIISCDGLTIYNPTCTNAGGASPQCGIDIEPNVSTESLKNLRIVNPVCRSNAGYGIAIYLDAFKTGSPDTVDIKIESPITKSNGGYGIYIKNVFNNTYSYSGVIEITDPVSINDGYNGIHIYDKGANGPTLNITNPVIINPCRNSAVYPNYSAISIIDTSASPSGGIHVGDIVAKCIDTSMNCALLLEYGQGIIDTSANVKSSTGHSVAAVRHSGLGSTNTIALASTVDIHCDNSRQEEARTASANLTDARYYALTLTNKGSTGQVTLNANQIPPKGVPYRFRCLSPQLFRIGLTNATTAKIIGTSAAGMTVSTTTVGAEGELYYFGSIEGVDYWQFRPIGAASLWTFN